MSTPCLDIAILGLSITSSWGNSHATTYRGLVRALEERGHTVLFLEREVPWCAAPRDLPTPPYGRTELYTSLEDLQDRFTMAVQDADVVMVGSYVPEGVAVGTWVTQTATGVTAFYDLDTPITLAQLRRGDHAYLSPALIPRYSLYLSYTGGPILKHLELSYGAAMARPLYCAVDPQCYSPEEGALQYDLGYMGTYSADRQEALDALLLKPAQHWPEGRFVVAGPQYPASIQWPDGASRLLQRPALHPEPHPSGDAPGWLCAQRPPVRSRGVCHTHHQRLLARTRDVFHAGHRTPGEPVVGRNAAVPARAPARGQVGSGHTGQGARPGRTYRCASGGNPRGVRA
jgi:hypothetical protein